MSREELIAHATRLGVPRPRVLTQPELIDEIITRTARSERERSRSRGWLGRARDLLAKVIERGLHLPDAAKNLGPTPSGRSWPTPPPALPTVTLAEIYAAQGHLERAISVLDDVLSREPDHQDARALRERFREQAQRVKAKHARPVEVGGASVGAGDQGGDAGGPQAEAKEGQPEVKDMSSSKSEEEGVAAELTAAVELEMVKEPVTASAAEAEAAPVVVSESAPVVVSESAPVVVSESAPVAEAVSAPAPAPVSEAASESEAAKEPVAEAAPAAETALVTESAAVAPVEETLALPQRYDVDEIVAIAVNPTTIYAYWEVRPLTFARAQGKHPMGGLAIRVLAVTPSWDGPVTKTWDVRVETLYGDRFISDIPPGANVRLSVGWLEGASFDPIAVGLEVASPRALPSEASAAETSRWSSEPGLAGGAPPRREIRGSFPARGQFARMAAGISWNAPGPLGAARAPSGEGAFGGGTDAPSITGGGTPSWVDPAAQRAAAPSFTRGGASELFRR